MRSSPRGERHDHVPGHTNLDIRMLIDRRVRNLFVRESGLEVVTCCIRLRCDSLLPAPSDAIAGTASAQPAHS